MKAIRDFISKNKKKYLVLIISIIIVVEFLLSKILLHFCSKNVAIKYIAYFILIDIILVPLFYLFMAYLELYKEHKFFTTIGLMTYIYFSIILFYIPLTFKALNGVMSYFAIIATILVVFAPEGLIKINEKTTLINKQPYFNEKELFEKNIKNIVFPLIIFLGSCIFIILLGVIFKNNCCIKCIPNRSGTNVPTVIFKNNYYIRSYIFSKNINKIIPKILTMLYFLATIFGSAMFISSYIGIFDVIRDFFIYVKYFEKLKSKYTNQLNDSDINWIFKNGLFGIFINENYNIKINSFDLLKNDFKELTEKNKFRTKKNILKGCKGIEIEKK